MKRELPKPRSLFGKYPEIQKLQDDLWEASFLVVHEGKIIFRLYAYGGTREQAMFRWEDLAEMIVFSETLKTTNHIYREYNDEI